MFGKWNGAFFYLLAVTFHAEWGSAHTHHNGVCVHLCMRACMYFITVCFVIAVSL